MSGKGRKPEDELAESRRQQAISDIRAVMATPEGRRWYWRLYKRAGVDQKSFSDSAAWTAYYEGRRSIGIEMRDEVLKSAPGDHVHALTEHLQLQREDESRRRTADAQLESENGD